MKKSISLFTTLLLSVSLFISCNSEDEDFVVIDQCEDLERMTECRDCCVTNGYDHGSPSSHADACECWVE